MFPIDINQLMMAMLNIIYNLQMCYDRKTLFSSLEKIFSREKNEIKYPKWKPNKKLFEKTLGKLSKYVRYLNFLIFSLSRTSLRKNADRRRRKDLIGISFMFSRFAMTNANNNFASDKKKERKCFSMPRKSFHVTCFTNFFCFFFSFGTFSRQYESFVYSV